LKRKPLQQEQYRHAFSKKGREGCRSLARQDKVVSDQMLAGKKRGRHTVLPFTGGGETRKDQYDQGSGKKGIKKRARALSRHESHEVGVHEPRGGGGERPTLEGGRF